MLVTLNLNDKQVDILIRSLKEHSDILFRVSYKDYIEEIGEIDAILSQFPVEVWNNAGKARENG